MSTDDTTPQLPPDSTDAYPTAAYPTAAHPTGDADGAAAETPIKAPLGGPTPGRTGAPVDLPRHRLRVGTAVWGLVIAIIGAGIIAMTSGAVFDLQLASIALLAVAGVAMLVGSIVSGARRRHP
jgi:hypothetical protein